MFCKCLIHLIIKHVNGFELKKQKTFAEIEFPLLYLSMFLTSGIFFH